MQILLGVSVSEHESSDKSHRIAPVDSDISLINYQSENNPMAYDKPCAVNQSIPWPQFYSLTTARCSGYHALLSQESLSKGSFSTGLICTDYHFG